MIVKVTTRYPTISHHNIRFPFAFDSFVVGCYLEREIKATIGRRSYVGSAKRSIWIKVPREGGIASQAEERLLPAAKLDVLLPSVIGRNRD